MNAQTTNPSFLAMSPGQGTGTAPDDERAAAVQRLTLKRHRAFKIYAGVLAAINAVIVAFWVALAIWGRLDVVKISVWPNQPPLPEGFFWPIFPIAICTVLVWMSARRDFSPSSYSDEVVAQEIARFGGQSPASEHAGRPAVPIVTRTVPSRPSAADTKVHVRRRGLGVHVLVYVVVNAVLVTAWALGGGGFFWPVYLMTAWGVGVLVNAYLAYRPRS